MVIKINTEIMNFIRSSDLDEKTKNFLINALLLEFNRVKNDKYHYFDEYDKIISKEIR